MIPCPHCDRTFEKRAGLMRHVTASHAGPQEADLAHPPADAARREAIAQLGDPVPVNPGGAIEPLVPVEPETYAESLDELAPGQEPYIDPPVDRPGLELTPTDEPGVCVDEYGRRFRFVDGEFYPIDPPTDEGVTATLHSYGNYVMNPDGSWHGQVSDGVTTTPVRITMDDGPETEAALGPAPSPAEYKQIRFLIRSGRPESDAWMAIVGHEPPPRPPQPVDERPLRLQQVAFRVRNGGTDQIDVKYLMKLVGIGERAVERLGDPDITAEWVGAQE